MEKMLLGYKRRLWCHATAAICALFVVSPITFMALERNDPVRIHSQELTGDFRPGGRVALTWSATASKYCEGTVRSRIISAKGIVYEYDQLPTVIRSSNGERGTYRIEFSLPAQIDAGLARRESHVAYYCNPLQRWLAWPIRTVREYGPFEIKP